LRNCLKSNIHIRGIDIINLSYDSSIKLGMAHHGLWTEVKERVEYGRRGDGGG